MTADNSFPWPALDTRSEIVRTVQRWNRALDAEAGQRADQAVERGTAKSTVAEPPPRARDERELRIAARQAPLIYPGAAGELIRRELLAVADFGYGPTSGQSLIIRLTDQLLTIDPVPVVAADPSHGPRSRPPSA